MIQDFIAEVRERGLARSNRYKVVVTFPNAGSDMTRQTMLMCEQASLPGLNIATQPTRTFGEAREMPYERNFEPITLQFYCDSGLSVKAAFEDWMKLIVNPQTRTIGYYQDFVQPITIYVDNVDDTVPYAVTLHEAYPKSMQAIQLDAGSKDIMRVSVTFQYKYWTSVSNDIERRSPPAVLRPTGYDTGTATSITSGGNAPYDVSPDGIDVNDPPVTEDEIIEIENDPSRDFGMNNSTPKITV